jgi:hypothetical protein
MSCFEPGTQSIATQKPAGRKKESVNEEVTAGYAALK